MKKFSNMTRKEMISHFEWCEYMLRAMVEATTERGKEKEIFPHANDWERGVAHGYAGALRFLTEGSAGAMKEYEDRRKKTDRKV